MKELSEKYEKNLGRSFIHLYHDKRKDAQRFWKNAKDKLIDVEGFHYAYDDDLERLGLLSDEADLFTDDGLFKDKSAYGKLKVAQNENTIESYDWALRAALRFCGLQFYENAKTVEQVNKEKRDAEQKAWKKELEERERERQEEQDHVEELSKIITSKAQYLVDNASGELKNSLLKVVEAYFKNMHLIGELNCLRETDAISRYKHSYNPELGQKQIAYADSVTDYESEIKVINFDEKVESKEFDRDGRYILRLEISKKAHEAFYNSERLMKFPLVFKIKFLTDEFSKLDGISNKEFNTIVFDKLVEGANELLENEEKENKEVEQLLLKGKEALEPAEKINQEIKKFVAQGLQPKKEIVDTILQVATQLRTKADREWDSWSNSTDGSQGAAYDYALYEGAYKLDAYMHDLHWDADNSHFHGGTEDEYIQALKNLISGNNKNIFFVK